jgi:hypothetical protein
MSDGRRKTDTPIVGKSNNRIPECLKSVPNLNEPRFPLFPHPRSVWMILPCKSPKRQLQPYFIYPRMHAKYLIEIGRGKAHSLDEVIGEEEENNDGEG